jgi:hypothetical protein
MGQLDAHDGQAAHTSVAKDTTSSGAPSATGSQETLPGDGGPGMAKVSKDTTAGKRGNVPSTGKPDKLDPSAKA